MSIARWSVERPVAVTMRIASLVLLGAICLTRLPVDLLPKVTIPTVAVNVSWPNVAPEEMETQVTRRLEEAVSSAPNLYQVSSTTSTGQSSVRIQFNWGTDVGQAAVDVLQLVQRAKSTFPNDPNLQEPQVFKFDPSTLPIMIYGVSGINNPVKLRTLLQNEIVPQLESANGVASITVTGGQLRAIIVDVDPQKLQAYGVTLSEIEDRIGQENLSLPAGIARQGNTEYTIRSVGTFSSIKEAAQIPLTATNGRIVTLGEVATVRDAAQEQRILTRLNGEPAVGLVIVKQSDANTVSTSEAVTDKIKAAMTRYPELKFSSGYEQAGFIENSIDSLKHEAIIGGALATLIIMLFLRSFRSTLVVALSIPISIVSSFSLLYFCGFTLNTISLSGLALSTGLIIDDAVVVLENIFRHIERDGRRAADAAVTGTKEITAAVVASTLTVVIVFMPLLLIGGQSGQTFTQFALVVIFSISISLLDAITVVPMLASRLISEEEVQEESHPELRAQRGKKVGPVTRAFDWFGTKLNNLDEAYRRNLEKAIRRRWWVLGGAVLISASSYLLVPFIGTELLPQTDSGDFTVNVKHPVGTAFAVTNQTMLEVERRLLANKDVQTVFSAAGTNISIRGTSSNPTGYQGGATVRLKQNRSKSTADVIKQVQRDLSGIPGVRIQVTPYDLVTQILTGGATNMEVDVFDADASRVMVKANEVAEAMRTVPGLESVDLGVQDATPEVQWKVDRQKATTLGVSFRDIAATLNTATSGSLSTYYLEKGYQYPIYVQVPENQRKSVDELLNLPIVSSGSPRSSKQILLSQVATPVFSTGPNQLTRINRQRFVSVTGRVQGRSESEVQADVSAALKNVEFDRGSYWDFGTNQKRRADEFGGLGLAVFLAIALIYMLLASQFESFIYPLIVLTSVPLSAVGVVLALFLTGRSFGLTAFIGLLMLIGIVVKNGILLVDYTNQLRGRGIGRDEAILTASPTRLRPILMTTLAAGLGMMPLALALSKGSETQAPLATAVIGGLSTSTVLTLFVVPCVYTMFDDLARRFRKNSRDLAPAEIVGPTVNAAERTPEEPSLFPAPEDKPAPGRSL